MAASKLSYKTASTAFGKDSVEDVPIFEPSDCSSMSVHTTAQGTRMSAYIMEHDSDLSSVKRVSLKDLVENAIQAQEQILHE